MPESMNSYSDSHESNKPSTLKKAVAGAMLAGSLIAGHADAAWNRIDTTRIVQQSDAARERAEAIAYLTQFFAHARELRDALPQNQRAEFAKTYLEMVALAKQYGIDYKKLESSN